MYLNACMYDVLSLVLIYSALSSTLTYIHMYYSTMHFYAYYSSKYIIIIIFMIRVRPSVCLFAASVALFQEQAKYINSSCCIKINDRSLRTAI